ncbi:hemagglutinin repeat-containing protein [Bordetella hinzii]|uniref:two-partner secretion domain-containing protein n=1 Tax=Bordetella hinzii TaxID=103855 RepID=UPI0039FBBF99
MNTSLYRLIFSKVLGMYVPVAEIKTAGRKKTARARQGAVCCARLSLLSSALCVAFGLPGQALAQITPATGSTTTHNSASGVPVINIAAPDAHGLSHNKFQQFNTTTPGAVFNNSLVDGRSQIAGQISRNPNLGSALATTILSEVTGTGASSLRGTLEVFGGKSNLIIANPNGISVNGLTTLNANSLTLSTGVPNVQRGAVSLGVNQGKITVEGGGVNTDGLSTFDLVAKLIQIDGPVSGSTAALSDIKAVAGSGTFDTATRSRSGGARRARSAELHSGYAIDGSAAGAMHGKAITLLATDAGLGVRQPGTLSAPGDISIDARGNVEVGKVKGRGLSMHSGADIKGAMVESTGRLSATAGRNLILDDMAGTQGADLTAERGNVQLGPNTGTGEQDASVFQGGMDISARHGDLILSRAIKTDILKIKSNNVVFRNAVVEATGKAGTANSVDIDVTGRIVLVGSFHGVDEAEKPILDSIVKLENGRPVVEKASSGEPILGASIGSDGGVRALEGDVRLKGATLQNQSGVIVARQGRTTVELTGDLDNNGLIDGKQKLTVSAQNIKNDFELSSLAGGVSITARNKLDNRAEISNLGEDRSGVSRPDGDHQLDIRVGAELTNSGFIASLHKITVAGLESDGSRPAIQNEASGRLDGHGLALSGRSFDSKGKVTVRDKGATVDVDGVFRSTNELLAMGKDAEGSSLQVRAGSVDIDGKIQAADSIKLTVSGDSRFGASVDLKGKNLDITTRDMRNAGQQRISGTMRVAASGGIDNRGKIQARTMSLTAQGDIRNVGEEAQLRSLTSLQAQASGDLVNEGMVRGKTLDLRAKKLDNQTTGSITATNTILTVAETLVNAGEIKVSGELQAAAGKLENLAGARLLADVGALTVSGDVANAGQVKIKQLALTANDFDNQAEGTLLSDKATLRLTQKLTNKGEIKVANLTADAQTLDNRSSGRIHVDDATLTTQVLANAGVIQASHDLRATTHDYSNTGTFSAGHDLTLVIKDTAGLTIDAGRRSPTANGTLILEASAIAVRGDGVQNPGNVVMKATAGNIDNYNQIAALGKLDMTASGDITNHAGALIWARDNVSMSGRNLLNQSGAWVLAQNGDITIKASTKVRNEVGRIEAGGNLAIDAPRIENVSRLSGEIRVSDSTRERVTSSKSLGFWSGGRWVKTQMSDFEVRKPISTLSVKQGVMRAGGDVDLNQHEQKGRSASVYNEGTILAGKMLRVDGRVENRSLSKKLNILDFLKMNRGSYGTWVQEVALPTGAHTGSYGSLFDMLDAILGNSGSVSLGGAYWYVPTENLAPVLAAANMSQAPQLEKILAAALGADWRGLGASARHQRWKDFKAGRRGATLDFYPMAQTVMAGVAGVQHTGGGMVMGGNATQSASAAAGDATRRQPAKIGKTTISTLDGTLDGTFDLGNPVEDIDLSFDDPVLEDLLGNRFMFGRVKERLGAKGVPSLDVSGLPKPFFETRQKFIDQKQFYGSGYFFERLGYKPQSGMYVSGDNYFDTSMILREHSRLLGGLEGRMGSGSAATVKAMMDNGAEVATRLGLEVGKPLTEQQASDLGKDVVWYVWATIDGTKVLMPRVYLARASQESADALRKKGGAVVASAGAVSVKTGGEDVVAHNAAFVGGEVDIQAGEGKVSLTSTGGVSGGIASDDKASVRGKDILLAGGAVEGKYVDLEASGKLDILVGMGYDEKGRLVTRDQTPQVGGESVRLAASAIKTEGAALKAENTLDMQADTIKLGAVKEMGSSYSFEVTHALGEALAALSQTIKVEQAASASDVGSTLTAGKLVVKTSGDMEVTGGTVSAGQSDIDIGGNLTLKAGENHLYGYTKESRRELSLGAAAGAGGYEASASLGSETGGKAEAGRGKMAGARLNVGFSASTEENTLHGKTYDNAQFNVGDGTVKVAGTADVGGADINRDRANLPAGSASEGLTIAAGDIKTTKYVDEIKTHRSHSSFTLGSELSAGSSIVTTASRFGDMIAQTKDDPKRKIDPALAAAMAATEATQLVFSDTGSITSTTKIGGAWGHSDTTETKENTQIFGGNIKLLANKGDISLVGTQFKGGDTVSLDAKGDVSLRAAKSTTVTQGEDHSLTLSASANAGVNAAMASAGVGISASLSGTHTVTTENSKTYQNAKIEAGQVNIKSGGNLALEGATVKASRDANIDVAGDTRIVSLQDDVNKKSEGGTWSVGAVASVNTKTIGSASATVGFSAEHHHDNAKVVREQAGISAGNSLNLKSGGNLELTGAHLTGESGSVDVGGKITATELHDKIDKDGGKGGASTGINPTTGLPMVNVEYGRDARDHVEATNKATIDIGDPSKVRAGKGVEGTVNTDKSKQHEITREEYYAGGESVLSVTVKPLVDKFKKAKKNDVIEHPPLVAKTKVVKFEQATEMETPKPQHAELVEAGVVQVRKPIVLQGPAKIKVVKLEQATEMEMPKPQYAELVEAGVAQVRKPIILQGPAKTKVVKLEQATEMEVPKPQHAELVEAGVAQVRKPIILQGPDKTKVVEQPVADHVDGGPKPKPKPEPKPKPQPQGGRYAVQEQVKVAQKLVAEMNQMKDVKGKLAKPVTLTFTGPEGPQTITITKREQLLKLDGKVLTSSPAQGAPQKFLLKIEDVGGKNYRVTYKTAK